MTTAEKSAKIDEFLKGADAFDDVLTFPSELLLFRPDVPEAWTIHEHVVHFLESEIATFHRYRKAIAEPKGPVIGYDEVAWTPTLNYHSVDLIDTVATIKLLRRIASAHLRTLLDRDWSKIMYKHSSTGLVSLEKWIDSYIDHVRFHREYIERNQKAFPSKK